MTRVRLIKLSVCSCGHPLLDESIPLGTEYVIEETNRSVFILTCGGCKRDIELPTVYVYARGKSRGGHLPEEAFEKL